MDCKILVWVNVLMALLPLGISLDQASFYGSSYILIPFKEAKSSTDIHFKFRTPLANALILLVAGTTDYCIVKLNNGRLQVNINLGAGETEVSSPQENLNDFKWHDVFIIRKEANLSIIIDSKHTINEKLRGKFFELNISFGLFVGGRGNFSELFFGHSDKFRGCLSEVMYNGILVLDQARHRHLQAIVQGVTWNCAAEFDADIKQPISFVEDDAFIVLPNVPVPNEFKLQLTFKTLVENSTIIYNSGPLSKPDFFAIELVNGNVKCILRRMDKLVEITHALYVSDGESHKLLLNLAMTTIDLNIDSVVKSIKKPRNHFIDWNDLLYVGGIEAAKRGRAMAKGLKTSDLSFKGCIEHLFIGGQPKGLPDVLISEGIFPGCVWQYPCLNKPCSPGSQCVQQGLDSFQCYCEEDLCVNPNYTESYKVFSHGNLATELELLSLEPLSVLEGQNTLITGTNLHVILDYPKYGIRESGINFTIVEAPAFGSVTIDIWPHEQNSFTMEDVSKDKVHYIHDGSENHHDHVVLEVQFIAQESYILPAYLQGRFKFTLAVKVVPVNDPPVLVIPNASAIRLAQGSRITVEKDILKVEDPDSTSQQLVFNVLEVGAGHFEYSNKRDTPISSFTQEDLLDNRIVFVHHKSASNESHVTLQVSDGIETSAPTKLRISTFPQYWRLQNNTGLMLMHLSSAIITPYNLSFVSNVASADDSAQFQVTQPPQYGIVELEKEPGIWRNAGAFTNGELKQHRVRYRHTTSSPDYDEFQFKNSLNTTTTYTFRLTFVKCTLNQIHSSILILNTSGEAPITSDHMEYQTVPIKSDPTSIVYVIEEVPKYGYLYLTISKYKLRARDSFSQEDVSNANVRYRVFHKSFSAIRDEVLYSVMAPGCQNVTGNLSVSHYPSNEVLDKVQLHSEKLQVDEGGKQVLDSTVLNIWANFINDLVYNVTQPPVHGVLQLRKDGYFQNGSTYFTSEDLHSKQLFYIHDGSETRKDSFKFLAVASSEDFQYAGTFMIDITLKNDNSPQRVVDKVFHIVVGGKRLLTDSDLKYSDADLDTKPSEILYRWREIPNGEIYNSWDHTVKISQFTQKDLDDKMVLFKHKGPEYGKMKLSITDGQFHTNGVLEIQASAPFIHVSSNKKLVVQHGQSAVLTREHLSYSTNLYAFDSDVIYEVIVKPAFGKIVLSDTLVEVTDFTQENITAGTISYLHESNTADADEVGLRVRCKDAVNVAQLGIWMLPASFWEPLLVKNCKILWVEESTSTLINKNTVEVVQQDVPAMTIVYHIHVAPQNGYISILSGSQDPESMNVRSFTQELVNENRVLYIQSGTNQTRDRIVFNVTNGMVWLHNLVLDVQIIPEHLYLGSNQLSVNEGGTATITTIHIFIQTEYYRSRVTDYIILQEPGHGCVQRYRKCTTVQGFTHKELVGGLMQYYHDDSENMSDELTVIAVAGQKRSFPVTMPIKVLPINDQKPKLVNNTGLTMWEGGVAVITNDMLAATDADWPKDTLRFQISKCLFGNISLMSDPSSSLQFFTQELIDKKLIVFRHHNGSEAKFVFNITDGLHTTKEHTFHINTKPVNLTLFTKPLHIFPLQRKYITSSHLLVTVSDNQREVYYEIVRPPTLGRLMMESETSGVFRVVSTFTQRDLNGSRVFYEHTHPFNDLYVNDSFVYNAKAHFASPILSKQMKIDISVSSGGLDAFVNIPKIYVDEGGMTKVVLNLSGIVSFLEQHAGLKSPIIHASITAPRHGQIFMQHLPNITTFTQQQLESGQIYYQHDHSDTVGDNIYFSVYLIPGYITLCNITIPVIVNPINDQAFKLVTPAPHITMVQGENHTIRKDELLTEDADTTPSDLKYDVFTGPSEGKLVLLPTGIPTIQFTQEDINENRVVYIHNSSVLSDQFHLRVWDGKFRPEYTVFNIRMIPLHVNVTAGLPVYLQQGSNVVLLSDEQFTVDTNANKDKIQYTVREGPRHGALYVKDNPARTFIQKDLLSESVIYMQTDMTTANDSFKVFAGINLGNVSVGNEIEVVIKVQPLMQIGNFTAIIGESNKISLHVLDATPLAKLTNSNPRYTIIIQPQYGQVRKIIRSSGEQRNVLNTLINTFTHEEIQSGLIYLVVKNVNVIAGYQDQLGFMLAASIFQPALGVLKVNLQSSLFSNVYSTLAGPNDPAGHEGGMHFASTDITRDYFLIVSMVSGIVILGIAIIVIIKCRSLEPNDSKKDESMQPIPLPRPPDRLMTSSPSLKQHVPESYISTLPAALPHCKVTPLSRTDMDVHTRYPYGVDEHPDDWSSCDASEPACPSRNIMLRRNQYWV